MGFCFLAYEDQRSTVLAVDNLNGQSICGREIMVDHVKQYKIPRQYMFLSESENDSKSDDEGAKEKKWQKKLYKPTGPDGRGWGDFRENTKTEEIIIEELE